MVFFPIGYSTITVFIIELFFSKHVWSTITFLRLSLICVVFGTCFEALHHFVFSIFKFVDLDMGHIFVLAFFTVGK